MRKIVVGIIAVFFVQVGFQVYLAVDRTNLAYRSVVIEQPSVTGPEVASTFDDIYVSPSAVEIADTVDRRTFRADTKTEPPKPQAVSKTQTAQTVALRPTRRESFRAAPIGPDVIITIPPPIRPNYVSTVAIANASPKREKKRSFLSKSLHVLKKPYDWLKTVAMKID